MIYPASENLEIVRTVEASHLPVKRTLAQFGILSSTYYQWYARWVDGGMDALCGTDLLLVWPASPWARQACRQRQELARPIPEYLHVLQTFPVASACSRMHSLRRISR